MDSVGKLRGILPQGDNKRPWYTFCDEAMQASLVYNKVFSSNDKGKPPTWGIDFYIALSFALSDFLDSNILFPSQMRFLLWLRPLEPQLVDFDVMLMDHSSLFTHVAITTKTKPHASMVLEDTSTGPPSTTLLTPSINPVLKRMATYAPSAASQFSKKAKKSTHPKKKANQVLDRDSSEEETPSPEVLPATGVVAHHHTTVVNLDSSTTISNQDLGRQLDVVVGPLGFQEELSTPFPIRSSTPFAQQITLEVETRKGKDPCYGSRARIGSFVLARRGDHLAIHNSSLRYKVNAMKKTPSRIPSTRELAKEGDVAKAWSVEKTNLQAERDNLQTENLSLQARCKELERAKVDESNKASEALDQAKRHAEITLASAATKVEAARIQFANDTLRSFLSSPAYDTKVGSECAAYLASLVTSTQGKFPDLVALFNE
ncbi:hypothetical protein LIER_22963 [Lithospermum erythrorhizon]|uniref:Uncharacterized protein n=1 Tax=Lithospermum erythrorhizon TaxID=34254 RepID=A0AAV3QYS1_LITER